MTVKRFALVLALLVIAALDGRAQVTTNPRITGALQQGAIPAGTGTATAVVCGVLEINTTQVGTDANTNEKDLWSYSLPANTLSADGKGLRITVVAKTASNGNNKTFRVYFGSTVLATVGPGAYNGLNQRIAAEVIRTGASAQVSHAQRFPGDANALTASTTPAETLTGAVTVKATGQNGTASANDIVFHYAIVECLK